MARRGSRALIPNALQAERAGVPEHALVGDRANLATRPQVTKHAGFSGLGLRPAYRSVARFARAATGTLSTSNRSSVRKSAPKIPFSVAARHDAPTGALGRHLDMSVPFVISRCIEERRRQL